MYISKEAIAALEACDTIEEVKALLEAEKAEHELDDLVAGGTFYMDSRVEKKVTRNDHNSELNKMLGLVIDMSDEHPSITSAVYSGTGEIEDVHREANHRYLVGPIKRSCRLHHHGYKSAEEIAAQCTTPVLEPSSN